MSREEEKLGTSFRALETKQTYSPDTVWLPVTDQGGNTRIIRDTSYFFKYAIAYFFRISEYAYFVLYNV